MCRFGVPFCSSRPATPIAALKLRPDKLKVGSFIKKYENGFKDLRRGKSVTKIVQKQFNEE